MILQKKKVMIIDNHVCRNDYHLELKTKVMILQIKKVMIIDNHVCRNDYHLEL